MNFFRRLFGGKDDESLPEPPSMPWDRRPSILELVRSHIVQGRLGLAHEGYTLPDEERVSQGSKLRWAPGALDGVMTHHMGKGENEESVHRTVAMVLAYSQQPTAANKAAVYQHIIDEQIVAIIDPVIAALVNEKHIFHDRLYEPGSFLRDGSTGSGTGQVRNSLAGAFSQRR